MPTKFEIGLSCNNTSWNGSAALGQYKDSYSCPLLLLESIILSVSLQPAVCTIVVLWLLMQKGSVLQRCPLHICCSSGQWHMLTVLAWAVVKRLSLQTCIFPSNNISWFQLQLEFFCSGTWILKSASGTYVPIKILKMLVTFSSTGSLELALPLPTCWAMLSM